MKLAAMDIGKIAPLDLGEEKLTRESESPKEAGFFNYLKQALYEVDGLQKDAVASAEKLALGDESYLHNTIIAYEKASLALQLTVEIRNKLVDAYQDIMRIQM